MILSLSELVTETFKSFLFSKPFEIQLKKKSWLLTNFEISSSLNKPLLLISPLFLGKASSILVENK